MKLFSGAPKFALRSLLLVDGYASHRLLEALMVTTADDQWPSGLEPISLIAFKTRHNVLQ